MATDLPSELVDGTVSICRTGIGDSLRSIIHFTPDEFELLYVRQDLYTDEERARERKVEFVENERTGFDSRETYDNLSVEPGSEPDIGEYEFTVRVFSEGFISRVLVGEQGIILTTDSIDMRDFETVAVALRVLLAESSRSGR